MAQATFARVFRYSRSKSLWQRVCSCVQGACSVLRNMPLLVTLHLYDVAGHDAIRKLNKAVQAAGIGAFHLGVEVDSQEYSYHKGKGGTGVFACEPKGCTEHAYRESISMGETQLSPGEVDALLQQLMDEWLGQDYYFLRNNSGHFSNALCERLGVGPVPARLMKLPDAAAGFVASARSYAKSAINKGKESRGAEA